MYRKFVSLLLCAGLPVSVTACSNSKSEEIYSQALSKTEASEESAAPVSSSAEELSGELKIFCLYYSPDQGIQVMADSFEAIHPNVTITVEWGLTAEDYAKGKDAANAAISAYQQRLAVELMSDTAPDILYDAGITSEKYVDSGLLVDKALLRVKAA